MTHYIYHEDAPAVKQVLVYLFLSGLFGIAIGAIGALISVLYPNMSDEARTLLAFVMIILSSTVTLWGAGALNAVTFFFHTGLQAVALRPRQ